VTDPGFGPNPHPALVLVLATEHPDRDAWVDERAAEEARKGGFPLAPYQGTVDLPLPSGVRVHIFAIHDDATAARERWATARAHQAEAAS
jgi:hypothetical protein